MGSHGGMGVPGGVPAMRGYWWPEGVAGTPAANLVNKPRLIAAATAEPEDRGAKSSAPTVQTERTCIHRSWKHT